VRLLKPGLSARLSRSPGNPDLHVITVVLHDAKGTEADVAALINGHRVFIVEAADTMHAQGIQTISLGPISTPRFTRRE